MTLSRSELRLLADALYVREQKDQGEAWCAHLHALRAKVLMLSVGVGQHVTQDELESAAVVATGARLMSVAAKLNAEVCAAYAAAAEQVAA